MAATRPPTTDQATEAPAPTWVAWAPSVLTVAGLSVVALGVALIDARVGLIVLGTFVTLVGAIGVVRNLKAGGPD